MLVLVGVMVFSLLVVLFIVSFVFSFHVLPRGCMICAFNMRVLLGVFLFA